MMQERYIISEAIATIQCKGYGKFMLGHLPTVTRCPNKQDRTLKDIEQISGQMV